MKMRNLTFTICSPSKAKIKMVGKLFLLAAVCAVLVQGEDETEKAIRRGLERVEGLTENAKLRIDLALNEVEYNKKLVQTVTSNFTDKSVEEQDIFEHILAVVCEKVRTKAQENKGPQSIFDCVDREQGNGVKDAVSHIKEFHTNVQELEKTKLQDIKTYAEPLGGKLSELEGKVEWVVLRINMCFNHGCVSFHVNNFKYWIYWFLVDIESIRTQIKTAVTDFEKEANTSFEKTKNQVRRLREFSIEKSALCLGNIESLFGKQ